MRAVGEGTRLRVSPGLYWVRLEMAEAYAQEGWRQGMAIGSARTHYVRRYLENEAPLPAGIWSLRDGATSTHMTAEVNLSDDMRHWAVRWAVGYRGAERTALETKYLQTLVDYCRRMDAIDSRVSPFQRVRSQ